MINYDDVTKENINRYSWNRPQIPDHQNRILLIKDSGPGKTNPLLNLIKQQDDDHYRIIV